MSSIGLSMAGSLNCLIPGWEALMKLFRHTEPPLRLLIIFVEWTLVLAWFISNTVSGYFLDKPQLFAIFVAYNLAFLGVSLLTPFDRPTWERRAYIALEMALIISAVWLQLQFDVLMYLVLLKSCLLLSRREAILTVILTGLTYLPSCFWGIPQRIQAFLEKLSTHGPGAIWNMPAMILSNTVEYVGVSVFVMVLGFVMVSERQNRQRAEALAQEVETLAANLERTRIAREIHDSLGHTLTSLDVQLEVAQKLRQRDPDQALQALDTAKLLATQCLQDVRHALQTIRQANFNLQTALTTLIEQIRYNQPFTIEAELKLPQLPLQTSHQLYCIIQEGLTNIQKHAQAHHIKLQSWSSDHCLTLQLSDDGKGFDPAMLHDGFGLRGMQERVQLMGGSLQIQTAPGQGTQIQVTIPILPYDSLAPCR